MPALHHDKTRAEKAANQRAKSSKGEVIPFARVKVSEVDPRQRPNAAAPSNAGRQQNITTSEKFDWIDAVMADRHLDARAKVIAYCLMQHLNRETGFAFVSDPTITDKTGMPNRWVRRARNDLRTAGWIAWKRTRTANVYSTLTEPMAAIAEQQQAFKDAREQKRRRKDRPQVAEPERYKNDGRPQVAEQDGPRVAEQERPQVADIPLSGNPIDEPGSLNISAAIDSVSVSAIATGIKPDFEIWWQQYPRKEAKLKAEKTYARIIKSKQASAAELLDGAARYAAAKAGQNPTFTKHPTTWLSDGGWMDESAPPSGLAKPGSAYAGLRSFVEAGGRGK
jgi:hypothetical protein